MTAVDLARASVRRALAHCRAGDSRMVQIVNVAVLTERWRQYRILLQASRLA